MNRVKIFDMQASYRVHRDCIEPKLLDFLESGEYILGDAVTNFENSLKAYCGAEHVIAVSSGTDALYVVLLALGVGPGDEVITTNFSFIAAAEAISLLGATPILVDICNDNLNINSDLVERSITSKTKAVIAVSLYGTPCQFDELNRIGANYGIPIIDDAAQSFGSSLNGVKTGNLACATATSFFPTKPLGCFGDGGAVFTNDDKLASRIRMIRSHGQQERYNHTILGLNARLDALQAIILEEKLKLLDIEIAKRYEIAKKYANELSSEFDIVGGKPKRSSAHALFGIFVDDRTKLQKYLAESGIDTAVHYPKTIDQQLALKNRCKCPFSTPVANNAASKILHIPFHAYLDLDDQNRVISTLLSYKG